MSENPLLQQLYDYANERGGLTTRDFINSIADDPDNYFDFDPNTGSINRSYETTIF